MANKGVLFLGEFPEWPRPARESLRHIMDTGVLDLHRADGCANKIRHGPRNNEHVSMRPKPSALRVQLVRTETIHEAVEQSCLSAPVQLEIGITTTASERSWSECLRWVQQHRKSKTRTWLPKASQLWDDIVKSSMSSKRLQRHLRLLAKDTRVGTWPTVTDTDVQEAYDVMWMTRPAGDKFDCLAPRNALLLRHGTHYTLQRHRSVH